MDKKIKEQILAIRATGETNMFDIAAVQRIAYDMDFSELIDYLEEKRSGYLGFILTGQE